MQKRWKNSRHRKCLLISRASNARASNDSRRQDYSSLDTNEPFSSRSAKSRAGNLEDVSLDS